MLVKCDKCGEGYDVNESRLSPQGARIKCKKCTHIFTVRLDKGQAVVSSPSTKSSSETTGVRPKPQKDEEVSWRIRNMGLTYTFHDLDSLRDWLKARPSLDDVKIAKGEDDWSELGDYSEVMTTELITKFFPLGDVPTSKKGTGNLDAAISNMDARPGINPDLAGLRSPSSLGPIANAPMSISSNLSTAVESKTTKQARQEKKKAEEAKKKLKKRYIILGVVFIVLLIGIIFILRINLHGGGLPMISSDTQTPSATEVVEEEVAAPSQKADAQPNEAKPKAAVPDKPEEPVVTDEELAAMADEDMQKRFNEAQQMVKDKKWPEALATLVSLVNDNPTHLEALQLLAKTYRALNRPEKAAEIDAQIKKVKAMADEIVIGE